MANPAGTNSPVAFDQFTREIPYGEKKVQGDLQRSVPLAGQGAVATPLNAPREAERQATSATTPTGAPAGPLVLPQAPPAPSDAWAQIAALPGITPLAADYASRAT